MNKPTIDQLKEAFREGYLEAANKGLIAQEFDCSALHLMLGGTHLAQDLNQLNFPFCGHENCINQWTQKVEDLDWIERIIKKELIPYLN